MVIAGSLSIIFSIVMIAVVLTKDSPDSYAAEIMGNGGGNIVCGIVVSNLLYSLPYSYVRVAWHSGITSVFGRRTFPVLHSTCS